MKLLILLAILAVIGKAIASPPQQFESTTESSTEGWDSISEKLANQLLTLGDKHDRKMIAAAINDYGLANNFHQFFRKAALNLSTKGDDRHFFVRPASEPYYSPFYGAHIFKFWLVTEHGKLLLTTAADKFSVLPNVSNNMHDLMISQCYGGYCYDTTLVYSHGQYRNQSCQKTLIATGEEISSSKLKCEHGTLQIFGK